MKCLVGIYGADEGAIYLDQDDVSDTNAPERPKWAAKIGMLFQQNALFDSLKVWENICFRQIELGTLSRKDAREHAVHLLGLVEDDGGGGDGSKQVRHVGFSRVVDLHPIYIASRVPTLAFWESFLFS